MTVATKNPGPPRLRLTTGFLDDPREALRPGHGLYRLAAHAHRWQATWGWAQHRSFFEALAPSWPRERATTRQVRAIVAGWLAYETRVSAEERAELLGVQPDTLRRQDLVLAGVDLVREDRWGGFVGRPSWHVERWGAAAVERLTDGAPGAVTRTPCVTADGEAPPSPPYCRSVNPACAPWRTRPYREELAQLMDRATRAARSAAPPPTEAQQRTMRAWAAMPVFSVPAGGVLPNQLPNPPFGAPGPPPRQAETPA